MTIKQFTKGLAGVVCALVFGYVFVFIVFCL